ncbi:cation diffusion facilitator family transporter [Crassaminicella profunda]|uniref:cation diffusion facilitator family transporter n=1 Tax=Crassaminicella profunda TaxID=1286698 RepID=UPI001FE77A14|nr:cation diffusion facilitator family transporter [Crassaminicella profunda]
MHSIEMDGKERLKLGNKIIRITIVLNVLLTIFKIGVGYIGASTAIIADGLHSASDIITSIGVIIGMFLASKPRDEKHQYGHEKAESIAGFFLAAILTLTGMNIGFRAIKIIYLNHYQIPHIYTGIVAFFSIIIKEYQFRITMDAAKKLNSNAMMSDAWHHRSDAFSSIAAFIGILGARLGYGFLDPLAGIIVSIIVVKVGVEILLSSIDELMDGAIDQEKMERIKKQIEKIDGIKSVTDFRGRKHGSKACIDIKICVDPFISVYMGHNIGEKAEKLILSEIKNAKEVIVHIDPCDRESCDESCKK